MVSVYALLDETGRCVNRVLWDGVSDWQIPDDCTAVPDDAGEHLLEVSQPGQAADTKTTEVEQLPVGGAAEEGA